MRYLISSRCNSDPPSRKKEADEHKVHTPKSYKVFMRRRLPAMGFFSSPVSDFSDSHHDLKTILKMNDISAEVQSHLKLVYVALAMTSLATAVGVFLGITMHLPAFLGFVGTMGWVNKHILLTYIFLSNFHQISSLDWFLIYICVYSILKHDVLDLCWSR